MTTRITRSQSNSVSGTSSSILSTRNGANSSNVSENVLISSTKSIPKKRTVALKSPPSTSTQARSSKRNANKKADSDSNTISTTESIPEVDTEASIDSATIVDSVPVSLIIAPETVSELEAQTTNDGGAKDTVPDSILITETEPVSELDTLTSSDAGVIVEPVPYLKMEPDTEPVSEGKTEIEVPDFSQSSSMNIEPSYTTEAIVYPNESVQMAEVPLEVVVPNNTLQIQEEVAAKSSDALKDTIMKGEDISEIAQEFPNQSNVESTKEPTVVNESTILHVSDIIDKTTDSVSLSSDTFSAQLPILTLPSPTLDTYEVTVESPICVNCDLPASSPELEQVFTSLSGITCHKEHITSIVTQLQALSSECLATLPNHLLIWTNATIDEWPSSRLRGTLFVISSFLEHLKNTSPSSWIEVFDLLVTKTLFDILSNESSQKNIHHVERVIRRVTSFFDSTTRNKWLSEYNKTNEQIQKANKEKLSDITLSHEKESHHHREKTIGVTPSSVKSTNLSSLERLPIGGISVSSTTLTSSIHPELRISTPREIPYSAMYKFLFHITDQRVSKQTQSLIADAWRVPMFTAFGLLHFLQPKIKISDDLPAIVLACLYVAGKLENMFLSTTKLREAAGPIITTYFPPEHDPTDLYRTSTTRLPSDEIIFQYEAAILDSLQYDPSRIKNIFQDLLTWSVDVKLNPHCFRMITTHLSRPIYLFYPPLWEFDPECIFLTLMLVDSCRTLLQSINVSNEISERVEESALGMRIRAFCRSDERFKIYLRKSGHVTSSLESLLEVARLLGRPSEGSNSCQQVAIALQDLIQLISADSSVAGVTDSITSDERKLATNLVENRTLPFNDQHSMQYQTCTIPKKSINHEDPHNDYYDINIGEQSLSINDGYDINSQFTRTSFSSQSYRLHEALPSNPPHDSRHSSPKHHHYMKNDYTRNHVPYGALHNERQSFPNRPIDLPYDGSGYTDGNDNVIVANIGRDNKRDNYRYDSRVRDYHRDDSYGFNRHHMNRGSLSGDSQRGASRDRLPYNQSHDVTGSGYKDYNINYHRDNSNRRDGLRVGPHGNYRNIDYRDGNRYDQRQSDYHWQDRTQEPSRHFRHNEKSRFMSNKYNEDTHSRDTVGDLHDEQTVFSGSDGGVLDNTDILVSGTEISENKNEILQVDTDKKNNSYNVRRHVGHDDQVIHGENAKQIHRNGDQKQDLPKDNLNRVGRDDDRNDRGRKEDRNDRGRKEDRNDRDRKEDRNDRGRKEEREKLSREDDREDSRDNKKRGRGSFDDDDRGRKEDRNDRGRKEDRNDRGRKEDRNDRGRKEEREKLSREDDREDSRDDKKPRRGSFDDDDRGRKEDRNDRGRKEDRNDRGRKEDRNDRDRKEDRNDRGRKDDREDSRDNSRDNKKRGRGSFDDDDRGRKEDRNDRGRKEDRNDRGRKEEREKLSREDDREDSRDDKKPRRGSFDDDDRGRKEDRNDRVRKDDRDNSRDNKKRGRGSFDDDDRGRKEDRNDRGRKEEREKLSREDDREDSRDDKKRGRGSFDDDDRGRKEDRNDRVRKDDRDNSRDNSRDVIKRSHEHDSSNSDDKRRRVSYDKDRHESDLKTNRDNHQDVDDRYHNMKSYEKADLSSTEPPRDSNSHIRTQRSNPKIGVALVSSRYPDSSQPNYQRNNHQRNNHPHHQQQHHGSWQYSRSNQQQYQEHQYNKRNSLNQPYTNRQPEHHRQPKL